MVIKSTVDYSQYKLEVSDIYLNKYPSKEKYVESFIKHISYCYNNLGRTYIPYKVMWYLYSRIKTVKRNQHFWIAFIGQQGGEGKSTLGKHMLYFVDPTFHSDNHTASNYDQFISLVYKRKEIEKVKNPSILLDEPDPEVHVLGKKGRSLRKILSKIRQCNLFVGVCANSLTDVPTFIYHRLTAICFLNKEHRFWLWDIIKDKPKHTIIEDIKRNWAKQQHGVFKDPTIIRRAVFKNLGFSPELPIKEEKYEAEKNKDLFSDIKDYIGIPKKKVEVRESNESLVKRFVKNNPNLTDKEIAKTLNLRREWVNRLKNRV